MTFKAILWDVDGTLVDSEKLHYECLKDYCREKNIPIYLSENETQGVSLSEIWHMANIDNFVKNKETWIKDINNQYIKKISPHILREGISDLVKLLDQKGYIQVCVSSGEKEVVEANLVKTGIHHYMKFWISREDVIYPKPNPEPYLKACELLKLASQDAIVIEDSSIGVKAAKAAGIFTIAFANAENKIDAIYSADKVVNSTQEIREILII
jgi:beta-phosphoglucomutase